MCIALTQLKETMDVPLCLWSLEELYRNKVCVHCTRTTRLLSHPASDLSSLLTNETFSLFTSYTHVVLFYIKT